MSTYLLSAAQAAVITVWLAVETFWPRPTDCIILGMIPGYVTR